MSVNIVRSIIVDPYHEHYVYLLPGVIKRLKAMLEQMEEDSMTILPQFLARLVMRDRGVLLLAAVDQTGKDVGVAAASVDNGQVLILQPKLDVPSENDAVKEMMDAIESWAKSQGVEQLTLVTRRFDPKWTKKFNFEVSRYILSKDLNA